MVESVDRLLDDFLNTHQAFPQVQYSERDQLINLRRLSTHFGLYDAGDFIKRLMEDMDQRRRRHTHEALEKKGVTVGSLVDYVRNNDGLTDHMFHLLYVANPHQILAIEGDKFVIKGVVDHTPTVGMVNGVNMDRNESPSALKLSIDSFDKDGLNLNA